MGRFKIKNNNTGNMGGGFSLLAIPCVRHYQILYKINSRIVNYKNSMMDMDHGQIEYIIIII
jgi:hypothetical protein